MIGSADVSTRQKIAPFFLVLIQTSVYVPQALEIKDYGPSIKIIENRKHMRSRIILIRNMNQGCIIFPSTLHNIIA